MAVDRHDHAALDRRRPLGIGGVDPLAAAVRGPAHELQRSTRRRGQPGIEQLAVAPRAPGRSCRRPDFADVDLGRERGEILRSDLRARPGRAQRPVEPVADCGRGCATGRPRSTTALVCRLRLRRAAPRASARSRSVRPLRSAPSPFPSRRRSPAARRQAPATGAARPSRLSRGAASDAQATVLRQQGNRAGALPARPAAREAASDRRGGCALASFSSTPGQ